MANVLTEAHIGLRGNFLERGKGRLQLVAKTCQLGELRGVLGLEFGLRCDLRFGNLGPGLQRLDASNGGVQQVAVPLHRLGRRAEQRLHLQHGRACLRGTERWASCGGALI